MQFNQIIENCRFGISIAHRYKYGTYVFKARTSLTNSQRLCLLNILASRVARFSFKTLSNYSLRPWQIVLHEIVDGK